MVSSVARGLFAAALVALGLWLLAGWRERSFLHSRGQTAEATVRAIYGSDPERSQEVWLEYTDAGGQSHWMHGKMAAPPRRNAKVPIKYHPEHPDRALLASDPSHYDFVTCIFGLYALGYGLFTGYRLWKR